MNSTSPLSHRPGKRGSFLTSAPCPIWKGARDQQLPWLCTPWDRSPDGPTMPVVREDPLDSSGAAHLVTLTIPQCLIRTKYGLSFVRNLIYGQLHTSCPAHLPGLRRRPQPDIFLLIPTSPVHPSAPRGFIPVQDPCLSPRVRARSQFFHSSVMVEFLNVKYLCKYCYYYLFVQFENFGVFVTGFYF